MDVARRVASQVNAMLHDSVVQHSIECGTPLLIAVSGGVDSMVLLHAMKDCVGRVNAALRVVHVDHGIRPTSGRDADFVMDVCRRWGIPARVRRIQLADIPKPTSRGVEADARELRYRAIADEAGKCGAECVFLAHHADDQLETVLWRLMRGTSLSGISGMWPITHRIGRYWLRPLLRVEKSDLHAYADTLGVPYMQDETNESREYTRNFIRLEVVPKLKEVQPGVVQRVSDFADLVREEDDYLNQVARRWVESNSARDKAGYRISTRSLLELARPLQRRAIHILLYCLASEDWTRAHVEGILSLANARSASAVLHLPNRLRVQREYDWLCIGPSPEGIAQGFRIPWRLYEGARLSVPVDAQGRAWNLACNRWVPAEGLRVSSPYQAVLPDVAEVVVHSARTSDRVSKLGMSGSQKLQDLFVNAKVPKQQRATWPTVEMDGQVIWVPGLARSRELLVDAETEAQGWRIVAEPPGGS